MNTIFKQGDTVEFTERYMGHNVGDRFTVTAVEPSGIDPNTQLVQGRKPNNHSGVFSTRLKLVQPAEHIYKVGDKVEVLESSTWHKVGPGEVTVVESDILRVKQPQHDNGVGFWVLSKHIRPLVEEPTVKVGDTIEALDNVWSSVPKGTRLIVTMPHSNGDVEARVEDSEDTFAWYMLSHLFKRVPATPAAKTELKFEVGARVRSKNGHYGDSEGIVSRLEGPFGGDIEIAWDKGNALAGSTLGATREYLEVTAPAPKTEKKKATLVDDKNKPQIGDTIVAFWERNGIETRKKGVVASLDSEGDYQTSDGEYINWECNQSPETAPHVYIVERAPRPEPVKVDPFEEAKAPFLEAAVGSKATIANEDLQYIKTGHDAWSLVTPVRIGFPRSTAALLVSAEDAKRLTLHVL